jgi:hypothetical protein
VWEFNWGIFWSVLAALAVWGVIKGIVRIIVGEFAS